MFTFLALGFTVASSLAHAAQNVEIPVQVYDVTIAPVQQRHFAEFRDIPKAMDIKPLTSAGNCHSLDAEKVVICHYDNQRSAFLAEGLFTFAKGYAQVAQKQESAGERSDSDSNPTPNGRWVEYRDTPKDVSVSTLLKAGELLGGSCHEMSEEKFVVCYYEDARTAGIDWEKLGAKLGEATSI